MMYFLDTNICIYLINKRSHDLIEKFKSLSKNNTIAISSIVLSELTFGVYNSNHIEKNLVALEKFMFPFTVSSYDENAAYHYGEIRADLKKTGTLIGQLDMMIAAHARSLNATLITNNTKEFVRVKKLKCENWI